MTGQGEPTSSEPADTDQLSRSYWRVPSLETLKLGIPGRSATAYPDDTEYRSCYAGT
ncbi:hypothetical protein [Nonomuraea ceibae]|uniref:hypothetical protein n=1 Tax=Nonomuraea ceibae TaxID=1935170 RepID=UPI001C5F4CA6|nr:hypothetical protein [Nonomuraea ceibae]